MTDAPSAYVWAMLGTLAVVYALIAFFFVTLLRALSRRWRKEDAEPERGAPYGPRGDRFEPGA